MLLFWPQGRSTFRRRRRAGLELERVCDGRRQAAAFGAGIANGPLPSSATRQAGLDSSPPRAPSVVVSRRRHTVVILRNPLPPTERHTVYVCMYARTQQTGDHALDLGISPTVERTNASPRALHHTPPPLILRTPLLVVFRSLLLHRRPSAGRLPVGEREFALTRSCSKQGSN